MNLGSTLKLNPVGVSVLCGLSFILLLYILAGQTPVEKGVSLKKLLIAAIYSAEQGGHVVTKFRNAGTNERSKGKTKEGAEDLVTDADDASNCLMYYSLFFTFPSLKIKSEEEHSSSDCQLPNEFDIFSVMPRNELIYSFDDVMVPSDDVTVWIDPLDATKEFTEQLYQYVTTMVCVAVRGKPVIGVIHQPFSNNSITSWVWLGKGQSPYLVIKKTKFADDEPVIIVSRSHAGDVVDVVKESMPQAKVVEAGGSGYKVLQLIKGNASAYIHVTAIKKWDLCAGNAVVNHFGGRLSTLDDEDIDYSETESEVVESGILAALINHSDYYAKLKSLKE